MPSPRLPVASPIAPENGEGRTDDGDVVLRRVERAVYDADTVGGSWCDVGGTGGYTPVLWTLALGSALAAVAMFMAQRLVPA